MDRLSTLSLLARAAALVVGVVAESWALQSSDPVIRVVERAQLAYARSAAEVLAWLGVETEVRGIRIATGGGSVDVTPDCVGLDVGLVLGSAMLVYPAPWRWKLLGFAAALVSVMALNWVRVVTLTGLAQGPRSLFELSHVYVWPGVVIAACVAAFAIWIRALPPAPRPGPDAPAP